jgi:UDP-N-acetylglucosamine 2-epimerase
VKAFPRNRIHLSGQYDFARINAFGFAGQCRRPAAQERVADTTAGLYCIEPLDYVDFLRLLASARIVLTDSGGIQEETTMLGVPCVTLRNNTKRPVIVTQGANVLAGISKNRLCVRLLNS